MPASALRGELLKRVPPSITIESDRQTIYQKGTWRGGDHESASGPRLFNELFSGRACTPLRAFDFDRRAVNGGQGRPLNVLIA